MSDSDDTRHEPKAAPDEAAHAADPSATEADDAGLSDERLRSLLQGALRSDDTSDISVLRGVQQKIRQRSRGKFYDDAWSTAEHPPIYTYLVTSALMLVLLFIIYSVLMPTAGEPIPVKNEPAPVQIIPPRP